MLTPPRHLPVMLVVFPRTPALSLLAQKIYVLRQRWSYCNPPPVPCCCPSVGTAVVPVSPPTPFPPSTVLCSIRFPPISTLCSSYDVVNDLGTLPSSGKLVACFVSLPSAPPGIPSLSRDNEYWYWKYWQNWKYSQTLYKTMEDNLLSYTTIFLWRNCHFSREFFNYCKNNVNEARNIPIDVKNNIKVMATEQVLYAQVFMLFRKDLNITEANKNKIRINSSSRVSLQDHSVVLVFIFIRLKKCLVHVNLVSIGNISKAWQNTRYKYI